MGDIKYDYPVIEQCIEMMKSKANEILNQTEDLEKDVKRIMVDWKGDTADAYDRLCGDLSSDLRQNADNLNSLKTAVHEAAIAMQQQDSSGAGGVYH